jgi:predicted RNase H-like nuclease
MELNQGEPIIESKKSHQGMNIRLDLIKGYFGERVMRSIRQKHPSSLVADDDIYDAFAALWTAERIHLGIAKSVPEHPEIDSCELPMAMWY